MFSTSASCATLYLNARETVLRLDKPRRACVLLRWFMMTKKISQTLENVDALRWITKDTDTYRVFSENTKILTRR